MRGESHHHLLEAGGVVSVREASVAGVLLDLGLYPGLWMETGTRSRVFGELVELEEVDLVLDELDRYEGPEYQREIIQTEMADGHTQQAWCWILTGHPGNCRSVPSGRWRAAFEGT